jgi:fructuronate reductase
VRLSDATLDRIRPGALRFAYDRAAQKTGIVHFGIGAFHRAHQAWYTDFAMNAGDRDWMIAGVSLRSPGVARRMNPQDGLYTLAERSADGMRLHLIGAVREVLVGTTDAVAIVARLANPDTHIASMTVTEKGYCRRASDGALDFDLAGQGSLYRYIAAGLRRRHDAGLQGLTLLSCDNLTANGRQLEVLLRQYLERHDPGLLGWFDSECACPSTMVDRIVPAATPADLDSIETALRCRDEAAVVTEPFSQWVIEDRFAGPHPGWDRVGVQLVADVAPYETAKLRMLNGAHSLLAYCGLARGYTFVHEAIGDPGLRVLAEQLMLRDAAPTIAAVPGQDLSAYASALIARFANPALNHRLIQIAMDGSQKIPQRWLETLEANRRKGRACPAVMAGLRAWLTHVSGANGPVDDPLAGTFASLWSKEGREGLAAALFGEAGMFGAIWHASEADLAALGSEA